MLSKWALNPITSVLIRHTQRRTDTQRRPCEDGGGSETDVVTKRPRDARGHRRPGAERKRSPLELQRSISPPTLPSDSRPPGLHLQSCERINFHRFRPPDLWYLVMAATKT